MMKKQMASQKTATPERCVSKSFLRDVNLTFSQMASPLPFHFEFIYHLRIKLGLFFVFALLAWSSWADNGQFFFFFFL